MHYTFNQIKIFDDVLELLNSEGFHVKHDCKTKVFDLINKMECKLNDEFAEYNNESVEYNDLFLIEFPLQILHTMAPKLSMEDIEQNELDFSTGDIIRENLSFS